MPLCDSLEVAIERATGKCAFFEWLIDLVTKKGLSSDPIALFRGDTCADINFGIVSGNRPGDTMAMGICARFIELDGESRSEELEGGILLMHTDEG